MITILHGDDIAASRSYFSNVKTSHPEHVALQAESMTITDLTQILGSGGLFQESKYILVEDLYGKKKSAPELKAFIETLNEYKDSHEIVLWEGKELTKSQLTVFPTSVNKVFKLPQTLFQFLDAIRPRNGKQLVMLFHTTTQQAEIEIVFFMLVRQFRLLLALHDKEAAIDEIRRMAPWQKTKLIKQSKSFSEIELVRVYQKLAEMDKAVKTGQLTLPLSTAVDMLLLSL